MKFSNSIGQLQGSISCIFMPEGTIEGGRALCEGARALCNARDCFANTMSIEGGADKAELDWEELESLNTHAVSHCTAWYCCASNIRS